MRRLIFSIVLVFIAFSCTTTQNQKKETIAVSILPQKYFVEQISGNNFNIEVLVAPGASHETYDPTPQQMVELAEAVLWIKNGHLAFEQQWEPKFLASHPQLKTFDWSEGVSLLSGECQHSEEEENNKHSHQGIDPHYWLSPREAAMLAQNIARALETIHPEKKAEYQQNLENFLGRIHQLDSLATKVFQPFSGRSFMIFHPALTYFAHQYRLKQIAVEREGNAPSAKGLREFIDLAREENIRIILVQQQFDRENAQTIAHEVNAQVIPFDPMSEDWENNILKIIQTLGQALMPNESKVR